MKVSRTVLAVVFTFIFAAAAAAQVDSKTEQMMDEVLERAKKIDTYKVDVRMDTQMMGQMMTTQGEMAFKKPDKMHTITTSDMMGGMKHEIFSSHDVVWTYMPMMNMATKIDMSKVKGMGAEQSGMGEPSDISKPFEGFPKDKIKFIEKKTVDGLKVYIFEAFPEKSGQVQQGQPVPSMLPHKVHIWINAENGLPHKLRFFAKDDSLMMEQTYSNFRINIPIDDSEFEFTPPEGAQVMDMTEATINMMKQMEQGQSPSSK